MHAARLFFITLTLNQEKGPAVNDISFEVKHIIEASGIANGTADITVVGSTGSVTTIEHEPGVVNDLKAAVNRLAPPEAVYEHELAWNDGNGHSHVQAALIGPSIAVPVRDGKARLGTWQQIVVINHDNRARKRIVEISLVGA